MLSKWFKPFMKAKSGLGDRREGPATGLEALEGPATGLGALDGPATGLGDLDGPAAAKC